MPVMEPRGFTLPHSRISNVNRWLGFWENRLHAAKKEISGISAIDLVH
jgi:hypothetical protein